jgi:hypothetical protein
MTAATADFQATSIECRAKLLPRRYMSRNVPTPTLLTPYVRLETGRQFGNIMGLLGFTAS